MGSYSTNAPASRPSPSKAWATILPHFCTGFYYLQDFNDYISMHRLELILFGRDQCYTAGGGKYNPLLGVFFLSGSVSLARVTPLFLAVTFCFVPRV